MRGKQMENIQYGVVLEESASSLTKGFGKHLIENLGGLMV